ncbi:U-box domain-containing protein 17-like [Primulina huaijiensis]|uniref:U-box domain-containing protein 17-like n=1 Tax=Primulina huaijiensis TaxID=1492673 RepID=UPI003CC74A18
MSSAAKFPLFWRRSLSMVVFPLPGGLSNASLLETLRAFSSELLLVFSDGIDAAPFFQRENFRSLIRKIQVISVMVDALREVAFLQVNATIILCLKELYLFLYRAKILLDYVKCSSKLWLLLHNHSISGHFHDLNQEISILLDVLPLRECNLPVDVKEQVELLRKQSKKSRLMIDNHGDLLRSKFYYFLSEFEEGRIPHINDLYSFFVEKLMILNVSSCRVEIEFLEEQIVNHDGNIEPTKSILNGFVALIRYSRFLLFRFEDEEGELGRWNKKTEKCLISKDVSETFTTIPKDFCCPISLEMMKDPVVVSTGQTYDRESISRWMEGHCTCPKTGQKLVHTQLVPNKPLRNLILRWCMANGISYDPLETAYSSSESAVADSWSKAVAEATKATVGLLVDQLANGTPRAKTVAALEIRLLAKTGKESRACIGEAGVIPLLKMLLSSLDAVAQENSITAMLNLSIYDKNKSRIMDVEGCLGAIAEVLRFGHTTEARENAAATLFSLSAVHVFKKEIAEKQGAIEALAGLVRNGTPRGKKDAVTALYNLSTYTENCARMIDSGAVSVLVEALGNEGVSEEAAGALALIVRQPTGAEAVGNEERAVSRLTEMMRCGTPRGKENAVTALLELCRGGGAATTVKVVNAPSLASLLQCLLFTGTKRARRKAASLARVFQRSENMLGVGYTISGNSTAMPASITVPVL